MNEKEIFKEFTSILNMLDEIENNVKALRKKHEESVEESLSIHASIKSGLMSNGFKLYISYQTDNSNTKENLDLLESLLGRTRKNTRVLKLFALSEIIHRRVLESKFQLTHPFFFKESKKTLNTIELDLRDLDEEISSVKEDGDIKKGIEDYEELIKRAKILENSLGEEMKSGLLGYLKNLFLFLIGGSGWLFYISEYSQMNLEYYLVLGFLVFLLLIPGVLYFWNYLYYGMEGILRRKTLLAVVFLITLLGVISSPSIFRYNFFDFLGRYAILNLVFLIILISRVSGPHKESLLEMELEDLSNMFFPKASI